MYAPSSMFDVWWGIDGASYSLGTVFFANWLVRTWEWDGELAWVRDQFWKKWHEIIRITLSAHIGMYMQHTYNIHTVWRLPHPRKKYGLYSCWNHENRLTGLPGRKYINMNIYTNTYIYMYTYIHMHVYIYIHIIIYTHKYISIYIYIYIYIYTHIYMCIYIYIYIHIYIYIYLYIYVYVYIYTYIHIYLYTWNPSRRQ